MIIIKSIANKATTGDTIAISSAKIKLHVVFIVRNQKHPKKESSHKTNMICPKVSLSLQDCNNFFILQTLWLKI